MMANINQNRRFDEGANTFQLPIRDLKEMQEKAVAPAKMKEDRVKFTRYDVSSPFELLKGQKMNFANLRIFCHSICKVFRFFQRFLIYRKFQYPSTSLYILERKT